MQRFGNPPAQCLHHMKISKLQSIIAQKITRGMSESAVQVPGHCQFQQRLGYQQGPEFMGQSAGYEQKLSRCVDWNAVVHDNLAPCRLPVQFDSVLSAGIVGGTVVLPAWVNQIPRRHFIDGYLRESGYEP